LDTPAAILKLSIKLAHDGREIQPNSTSSNNPGFDRRHPPTVFAAAILPTTITSRR
jgi:hypothetical protein